MKQPATVPASLLPRAPGAHFAAALGYGRGRSVVCCPGSFRRDCIGCAALGLCRLSLPSHVCPAAKAVQPTLVIRTRTRGPRSASRACQPDEASSYSERCVTNHQPGGFRNVPYVTPRRGSPRLPTVEPSSAAVGVDSLRGGFAHPRCIAFASVVAAPSVLSAGLRMGRWPKIADAFNNETNGVAVWDIRCICSHVVRRVWRKEIMCIGYLRALCPRRLNGAISRMPCSSRL